MSVAVEAYNLSKKFIITHQKADNIREYVNNFIQRIVGRYKPVREQFWAIQNINFTISNGEAIAILGHNGSGKSTLLKILARVSKPTEGRLTMRGRVCALLEVGTGFHPDFTGRENIFVNGSILGMTREEIIKNINSIIAFSGIEKFIDTPVKFYSSGMYMRLAFAIAVHVNPDILILDEVLAVGDLSFQSKCIDFIKNLKEQNKTIILISHDMKQVQDICTRGLYVEGGKVLFDGDIQKAIELYKQHEAV